MGRDHLKATLGWTMVLHTWKRDLGPHIPIHVLVTAGGLLLDGSAFRHAAGLNAGFHAAGVPEPRGPSSLARPKFSTLTGPAPGARLWY
jgi:hypothetical protein